MIRVQPVVPILFTQDDWQPNINALGERLGPSGGFCFSSYTSETVFTNEV